MGNRDVVEFIIVPPFSRRDEIGRARERLQHFLSAKFPGYTFKVPGFVPVGEEDEFTVMPIMNFCGDDGKSYMCTPPKRWFVAEIAAACDEFDRDGRQGCAA